ncbi:hypothetical protein ACS8E2_10170 [Psychrobacter glaciei]|uniref:hypothetical protein n=1 Tax=Psychrobacter glaciei TaxID=619771 RepID=UPI003F45B099
MDEVGVDSKWRCKHSGELAVVKSLPQRCVFYDMGSKECHSDIVYFLNNFEPLIEVSE